MKSKNAPRGESEYYALNQEQRQELVDVATDLREICIAKFPMYLGFRVSETLHFVPAWVNKDSSISLPRKQDCACKACSARGFWKPKTKAGIRKIYATDDIWELIKKFFAEYPGGFLGAGDNRQSIYYVTKKLLKLADITIKGAADDVAFPHALRATCATWLAENDMNAAEIMQFMGWENISIAERYINRVIASKNTARKLVHATK